LIYKHHQADEITKAQFEGLQEVMMHLVNMAASLHSKIIIIFILC